MPCVLNLWPFLARRNSVNPSSLMGGDIVLLAILAARRAIDIGTPSGRASP
jgi:hypothetical protein